MREPLHVRRIAAGTLVALLATASAGSALPPRNAEPVVDPQVAALKKLIQSPALAGKLGAVRDFGLDPNDPDLAVKLNPIVQQRLAQRKIPAAAGGPRTPLWVGPPGKTAVSTQVGTPGGPILVNGAVSGFGPVVGPGDVLAITGAGLAPGGTAGPVTLVIGQCGSHTLVPTGLKVNADGTQSVFVTLPDMPHPILANKLKTAALITVGSTTFNVMYAAAVGHFFASVSVMSMNWTGTRMSSLYPFISSDTAPPLGFKEGVNGNTQSGGDERWQFIGLGTGGDDQLGTGAHLINDFTVAGTTLVGIGGHAASAQLTRAPAPGSTALDTSVHWSIGPTFMDMQSDAYYAVQWDLVGPLGARPIDTITHSASNCDTLLP